VDAAGHKRPAFLCQNATKLSGCHLLNMKLTLGQVAEELIVTLTEKQTLTVGYYLFIWTHYTTKQVVTKIYNFTEDTSDYQNRFNNLPLNTNTVFASKPIGQWIYKVYEQSSDTNVDPDLTLTELETGIMTLHPATEFSFTEYTETTTFKSYNG
jgi:hypothetical protein